MATKQQIAETLRRMGKDARMPTPEQARRIARGVADRALGCGLWTREEASQFVASLEARLAERECE